MTAYEPLPDEPLPEDFRLYQSYPNPFSDETTIDFDVFQPGKASITIYNILGQKVKTLVEDYFLQKHHITFWDGLDENGKRVAAGIYFYKLETAHFSTVKRMVYLGVGEK